VRDEYGLGIEKFFEQHNPAARQQQLARFLEVERRGLLPLGAEDRALLASAYVRSVVRTGAGCSALICGNRTLRSYAVSLTRSAGAASAVEIRRFTDTLRAATSAPPTGRQLASSPSAGKGLVLSGENGGRMRMFTVSAEQWQQRLAAVGTLAFDPRIWAAIALMYCLALLAVATAKRAGQRRAALTELCLNLTKESHQDAHR